MKQINISRNFSLKALMKSSDFIFDYIDLLYYKCYKINLNHSESNLNFSLWVKKDSIEIFDNKCFEYAATVSLNNKEIRKK